MDLALIAAELQVARVKDLVRIIAGLADTGLPHTLQVTWTEASQTPSSQSPPDQFTRHTETAPRLDRRDVAWHRLHNSHGPALSTPGKLAHVEFHRSDCVDQATRWGSC